MISFIEPLLIAALAIFYLFSSVAKPQFIP